LSSPRDGSRGIFMLFSRPIANSVIHQSQFLDHFHHPARYFNRKEELLHSKLLLYSIRKRNLL